MSHYRVSLWPGSGAGLETVIVEAFSPEEALSQAVQEGIGFTISREEFEDLVRDEMSGGASRMKAEQIVEEQYTWADPPGRYVLMLNGDIREADDFDAKLARSGLTVKYGGNMFDPWCTVVDRQGHELCKCMNCNRIVLEDDDSTCPVCGDNMLMALNVSRPENQRLVLEEKIAVPSHDRKKSGSKSKRFTPLFQRLRK